MFEFKSSFYVGILILCSIFLGIQSLTAQQFFSNGASVQTPEGSVSFSLGQIVYTYSTDNQYTQYNGVQQVWEIGLVYSDNSYLNLDVKIYPNPCSDNIWINIEGAAQNTVTYEIINPKGEVLQVGELNAYNEKIYISDLPPSLYLVRFTIAEDSQYLMKFIKI
jgi:hypothetical protein